MTLVERFIEVNAWPTCRKVVLLCALAMPGQILAWAVMYFSLEGAGIADVGLMSWLYASGVAGYGVALLLGLRAMRMGRDGAWIPYLLISLYGVTIAAYVYVAGLWSTIIFALYPILAVTAVLYFGARLGWFSFFYVVVWLGVFAWLEARGVLPHAPFMLDRDPATLRSLPWILGTVPSVLLFHVFCFVLGVLVVSAQAVQAQRLREAQRLISRYVPSQLAAQIAGGAYRVEARPERTRLTIVFTDIEAFTEASDRLDPQVLATLLNEYLSAMAVIAERHGGTIGHFVGDGMLILFGAPAPMDEREQAARAVRMAIEMQARVTALQPAWSQQGASRPLRVRIGINTGESSVGDYGSEGRKVYTAIGMQTNLAARLQSHCVPGRILISATTQALLGNEFACTDCGELSVKGVAHPLRVYEVGAALS